MRKRLTVALAMALSASAALAGQGKPYWLEPMRKVHKGFRGIAGHVTQFGDSITYSMAFWAPVGWADPTPYIADDGLPKRPKNRRWRDIVKGARAKGPANGNYSGWRVDNILRVTDRVLARDRPEAAIIMVGTNDISGGTVPPRYRAGLETIVEKCLAAGCVPILNTIPPRRGRMKAVEEANKIVKEVALKHKVPLVDYCAEILRLRPGNSWDGTMISNDGVHPTAGKTQVYTQANMRNSGYAFRNWLNFKMYRQIYFAILAK